MKKEYDVLRLILGDQLNHKHHWYQEINDRTLYIVIESIDEATYVKHHIQKVVGFFVAMRSFAEHLRKLGHEVYYLHLDSPENQGGITDNLAFYIKKFKIRQLEYQMPDEYRLEESLNTFSTTLNIPVQVVDTEHFMTKRDDVENLFAGKKQYLMETFYRQMRKKYAILMEEDGSSPLGGSWNYDQENRKKLPQKHTLPAPLHFQREVTAIVDMLKVKNIPTLGEVDPQNFTWPVTRAEALLAVKHFLDQKLKYFGAYQDAMVERDYLLYHSRLSFALNIKLLDPLEVVQAAEQYWRANQSQISLPQVEGFIRQIIGWREYMRGIYWAKMPAFATLNYFNHQAALPEWYWTADTKMNCLKHSIGQSLTHAYAHHIQRLMVTGNFALLLGVHPDEVDHWYLGIYMDAIQWVEITNTRGMSQYADGGIVGTKPYVSSANYMDKMSDYCKGCYYNKKEKTGDRACPFNSLYWDFYDRHRAKLSKNPRVGMMYRVWDRYTPEVKASILKQAETYKEQVNQL